ncbi:MULTISPECIES: S1C family serine protease [Mycolicibacterium]|jgi:S1-C subfamily serine protease|nr:MULTISPECIES: trypsin-like peptidase domain-containing protein [Mycolicibacterium]
MLPILAITVVFSAACSGSTDSDSTGSPVPPAAAPRVSTAPVPAVGADLPGLVRRVEPSVVTVLTEGGVGSGIVYKPDGTIVTNAHVVDGMQGVTVVLADGSRVAGTVRGADEVSDLAVIQVDRTGLPAATFQKPLPQVGELAVVMGSPLGFEATVTSGIISGLHRQIPGSASSGAPLVDLIQTDAAISPGNSGGAVLDADGEVVGMSVAYIPPTAGAVALGFAIPAATVVDVADQLLNTGTARHSFIGIQPATLTPEISRLLGIDLTSGVVAMQVVTPSPAAEAGIRPGDIIIAFNGQETATAEELIAALRSTKPGDRVQLSVLRGDKTQDIAVIVAERAQ